MTKFVTPNNLIAFPSHKGNGFASPRKETTDTTPNNSAEQPKPLTITDTFLKTTLEKPISTATNTPTEVATAQQALAPLANLPTPVSQLMAGTAGNGMAPQIYVINAGGTPAPPPTIDMEVDTTTPSPLNNGGLLGMNPTTSVSLHEGVGGHHAEEHHGGGGKFNWFNAAFPFPLGSDEGFGWWSQFSSGAAVGASLAFMANLVGLLFEDDYLRPMRRQWELGCSSLNKIPGIGGFLEGLLTLPIKIFEPRNQNEVRYNKTLNKQVKYSIDPVTLRVNEIHVANNPDRLGQVVAGGYTPFVQMTYEPIDKNILTQAGEGFKQAWNKVKSRLNMGVDTDAVFNRLLYPSLNDAKTIIEFEGNVQQPKTIRIQEFLNNNRANLVKTYQFDEASGNYILDSLHTLNHRNQRVKIDFTWNETLGRYEHKIPTGHSLVKATHDMLNGLVSSGKKSMEELAPLAKDMLEGIPISKNGNIAKNTFQDLIGKFVPWKGMVLGGFIGSIFAMWAGYYEMGHKHLSIENHEGGHEGNKGKNNKESEQVKEKSISSNTKDKFFMNDAGTTVIA